jgi:hypothetical protein
MTSVQPPLPQQQHEQKKWDVALRLGKTQLKYQRLTKWQQKWDVACELLAREPVQVTDVDGSEVRVTPDRLVSTCRHTFWIDRAYAGWSVDALRQACTEAGILRLLEYQGWSRIKTTYNRRKQEEPKRRRLADYSNDEEDEQQQEHAADEEDPCPVPVPVPDSAQEPEEAEPLLLTAEEAQVIAPVRSALRKLQDALQGLTAQLAQRDEEIARLREQLADSSAASAASAPGECAMCAVLRTTVASLQRNIQLLEADNERLQGLGMLWMAAEGGQGGQGGAAE